MAQMNPYNVNNENNEMCVHKVTVGSRSFASLFPIPLHNFNIHISYIDSRSSFILLVSHLSIYLFTTHEHGSPCRSCVFDALFPIRLSLLLPRATYLNQQIVS
jgi:hypothetical protein